MRYSQSSLALLISSTAFRRAPTGADAAAMHCGDEPCVMNYTEPCADVASTYRLYGTCCSLMDITSDDGSVGCQLTIAGNNTACNYRDPGYSCIPEEGCLPEFNVWFADTPGIECPASSYDVPTERQQDGDAVPQGAGEGSGGNENCPYVTPATITCVLADTDETIPCQDIQAPESCANGMPVYGRVKFSYDLEIDGPVGAAFVQSVRHRTQMTSTSNPDERTVPSKPPQPGQVLVQEGGMATYKVMDWEIDPIDLCDPTEHETTWNFETTSGQAGGPNCLSTDTHTFAIEQAPPPELEVCSLEITVGCFLDDTYTQKCEDYDGDCSSAAPITVYYRYTLRNPSPANSNINHVLSKAVRVRNGQELDYLPTTDKFDNTVAAAPGMNTLNFPETVNNYQICGRGGAAPPATTFQAEYASSTDPSVQCSKEETYNPAFAGLDEGPAPQSAGGDEDTSGASHYLFLSLAGKLASAGGLVLVGLAAF